VLEEQIEEVGGGKEGGGSRVGEGSPLHPLPYHW